MALVARRPLPVTAVLGAGPNGLTLAGYLARMGAPVHLWNHTPAPLKAIQLLGGIRIDEQLVRLTRTPAAIAQALEGAEVIIVTQPPSALLDTAQALAPYLAAHQLVLLVAAGVGSALEFRQELEAAGCRSRVTIAEVPAVPLDNLNTGPAMARVLATKAWLPVGTLPCGQPAAVLDRCGALLPMLAPVSSVLECSLQNPLVLLHAVITLLNAGRISAENRFRFYIEGITPEVVDALAAADAERCAVARAYGVHALPVEQWLAKTYGTPVKGLPQALVEMPAFQEKLAPTGLRHRYVDEDVPAGLVPLQELARLADVGCPALDGLVEMASRLNGRDYRREGRTLARMGLTGLTPDQVRLAVQE